MKKIISVVLTMLLLVSALPMVSVGAEPYPMLELDTPIEVSVEVNDVYTFSPEKDGWYKFYSTGECDPYINLYNEDWEEIQYADDNNDDLNFVLVEELFAGYTYFVILGQYDDIFAPFEVCVEEIIGVESVEITQEPYDTTVIEGFEYETYDASGLEAVFTFFDGSTVEWSYDEDNMVGDFYVEKNFDEDGTGQYYLEIMCGNAFERFFFTTVENQVESIEYNCDTNIEHYVNSGGYYSDGDYMYNYDIPDDAVITINYKDGTSLDANYNEVIDGVSFDIYDDQHITPWGVGENYFIITYLGAEVQVPVTILPCPFKSVTVNSVPTKEYIYGDYSSGYLDEEGLYTFWPIDLTGLSFTVEYEDGITQTYDDDDIDMDMWEIDGYGYEVSELEVTGPCTVEAVLYYKGAQIKYAVDVVETHIESIEFIAPPQKTEFEECYYGDYTGAVIKLNYKDGTSAQATANEDTMSYYEDGTLICEIQVGEDVVSIFNEYDYDLGYTFDYITCCGVGMVYDEVTYVESREIESIVAENVSIYGDQMKITVNYYDGTSEQLTYTPVYYYGYSDYYTDAYARTENGIAYFSIEKVTDDEDNTIGYYVYTLGESYFVEVSGGALGDVNGDGEISVMDATVIQRHVAKLNELEGDALVNADVNGDGEVGVMDATVIQRHVAKIENII